MDGWNVSSHPIFVVRLARSFLGKLTILRKYGSGWQAVGRGLRLLLQGRFATFLEKLEKGQSGPIFDAPRDYNAERAYEEWQARRLTVHPDALPDAPPLSVVMGVSTGDEPLLRSSIDSVLRQTNPRWELCAGVAALAPEIVTSTLAEYAAHDPRIRYCRVDDCSVSGLSNGALQFVRGKFIVLLKAGDEFAAHALHSIAKAIVGDPNLDFLYSDEDQIDREGRRRNPFFKPGWSPEYLLGRHYAFRVGVLRTSLMKDMGGLRVDCGAAADYDLTLRVAGRTSRIRHIPDILYHCRIQDDCKASTLPSLAEVNRALKDHFNETAREGAVEAIPSTAGYRVRFRVIGTPLVSVIIPTAFASMRGAGVRHKMVARCVQAIRERSTWLNYEILIVADREAPDGVAKMLAGLGARIIFSKGRFNFAANVNLAVRQAQGTHLLLLNDDTEVITSDWIESMLEYSQQPNIGAVGATLLFPHGRLQHVGLHILNGMPLHAFYGYPADHPGYFGNHRVPRNYCAVTAACMMTRRELFEEVGGLDPVFPLNFNDVDYCLRVLRTGRRVVSTSYARLYHHEAITKRGINQDELRTFQDRWGKVFPHDPFYNPNFATQFPDYRINPDAK
jgi:GT2 family glycosyltransferase